jgi:hypothetical protein
LPPPGERDGAADGGARGQTSPRAVKSFSCSLYISLVVIHTK